MHEALHILTEKKNELANVRSNHDRLKLAGLATTNEASVGPLSYALKKLPILWALQRFVFERDVHVINSTRLVKAVDALWLHNCTATGYL